MAKTRLRGVYLLAMATPFAILFAGLFIVPLACGIYSSLSIVRLQNVFNSAFFWVYEKIVVAATKVMVWGVSRYCEII